MSLNVTSKLNAESINITQNAPKLSPANLNFQICPDFISDTTPTKEELVPTRFRLFLGTNPQNSTWDFFFPIVCEASIPQTLTPDDEPISKESGAQLYDSSGNTRFSGVFTHRLAADVNTLSIILRAHPEENVKNTLIWHRKAVKVQAPGAPALYQDVSFFKLVKGQKYDLSITFGNAQKVSTLKWTPFFYLYSKGHILPFTKYTIAWAKAEYATQKEEDAKAAVTVAKEEPNHKSYSSSSSAQAKSNAASSQPVLSSSSSSSSQKSSFNWAQFVRTINSLNDDKSISAFILPPLPDLSTFNCEIPLTYKVGSFLPTDEGLPMLMASIEAAANAVRERKPETAVTKTGVLLYNFLGVTSQLYSFWDLQQYIANPDAYVKQRDAKVCFSEILEKNLRQNPGADSVENLILKGKVLLKRLCQRAQWVLEMNNSHSFPLSSDFLMKILAADRQWVDDANSFLNLLTHHPQKFQDFEELIKKGATWPHSILLLRIIRKAGYKFEPHMLRPDHCVCEECGVEVSGWRPWHDPKIFHNLAKHAPKYMESLIKQELEMKKTLAMHPVDATAASPMVSDSKKPDEKTAKK